MTLIPFASNFDYIVPYSVAPTTTFVIGSSSYVTIPSDLSLCPVDYSLYFGHNNALVTGTTFLTLDTSTGELRVDTNTVALIQVYIKIINKNSLTTQTIQTPNFIVKSECQPLTITTIASPITLVVPPTWSGAGGAYTSVALGSSYHSIAGGDLYDPG